MRDLLLLVLEQTLEAGGKTGKALDLAGDDDLRRLSVGGLFKGFERLELDDLTGGVGGVEELDGWLLSTCDAADNLPRLE